MPPRPAHPFPQAPPASAVAISPSLDASGASPPDSAVGT